MKHWCICDLVIVSANIVSILIGEKLLLSDAFKAVGYSVHEEGRTQHHHRVLEDQSYVPITEGSNLGDMKALKHGIDQGWWRSSQRPLKAFDV